MVHTEERRTTLQSEARPAPTRGKQGVGTGRGERAREGQGGVPGQQALSWLLQSCWVFTRPQTWLKRWALPAAKVANSHEGRATRSAPSAPCRLCPQQAPSANVETGEQETEGEAPRRARSPGFPFLPSKKPEQGSSSSCRGLQSTSPKT